MNIDRPTIDEWLKRKRFELASRSLSLGVTVQDIRDAAVLLDQLQSAIEDE
jgi:hypothetical protein